MDDIERLLIERSEQTGAPLVEVLAALVKSALMSDEEDAFHVYGIDFINACDRNMMADNHPEQYSL